MDDNLIPARAVTALLQEILSALDTGGTIYPDRAAHVVFALRHLFAGPVIARGDLVAMTAILTAHIAETPAEASTAPLAAGPSDGPFRTPEQADDVFAAFIHAAENGTSGAPGEQLSRSAYHFKLDALTDTLDELGVEQAEYDRQVIREIADLLSPTETAVLISLFQRAAHDRPDRAVHVANPDMQLPEAAQ
jgi:hypothetical protein